MWLAGENGMFLRHTSGEWVTKMPEHMNLDWIDGVKVSLYMYLSNHYSSLMITILLPSSISCGCFFYSKFSSTSLKELQDHISKQARLHLFGIISLQVIIFIKYIRH